MINKTKNFRCSNCLLCNWQVTTFLPWQFKKNLQSHGGSNHNSRVIVTITTFIWFVRLTELESYADNTLSAAFKPGIAIALTKKASLLCAAMQMRMPQAIGPRQRIVPHMHPRFSLQPCLGLPCLTWLPLPVVVFLWTASYLLSCPLPDRLLCKNFSAIRKTRCW